MRKNKLMVLGILIFTVCLSISLSPIPALAQSNTALQPAVSLPAHINEGPIPGGYIMGYALDEDGNPVPGATVSLLQDGQPWLPDLYGYPRLSPGVNPQTTRIKYANEEGFLREGSFIFGLPLPDEYTIAAEKDGYNGSVNVHIDKRLLNSDDQAQKVITVNVTLKNYHAYDPGQLSYSGGIVGEIRTASGYGVSGGDVSLWKDGKPVKLPNNPQTVLSYNYSGVKVDYVFEHLAPGRYTVIVPYRTSELYYENVTVDVGTQVMRADVVLSHAHMTLAVTPTTKFSPTIGVFSPAKSSNSTSTLISPPATTSSPTSEAKPSPALAWWAAPLVMVTMTYVMLWKRDHL